MLPSSLFIVPCSRPGCSRSTVGSATCWSSGPGSARRGRLSAGGQARRSTRKGALSKLKHVEQAADFCTLTCTTSVVEFSTGLSSLTYSLRRSLMSLLSCCPQSIPDEAKAKTKAMEDRILEAENLETGEEAFIADDEGHRGTAAGVKAGDQESGRHSRGRRISRKKAASVCQML